MHNGGSPSSGGPEASRTIQTLRKFLLITLILGITGTLTELFLLEHTEAYWQKVPLILLGLGIASLALRFLKPSRATLRMLQGLMVIFILSGLVGIFLHYRGNVEFELEMTPSQKGVDLFVEAITGATPALAPGTMVYLGMIGFVYCFRHPLLGEKTH